MSDRQTTTAGAPIADNQNSLTAGPRGPVLLEDYELLEKLAHQNRERIPERVVHAKGWGAFGTLTITNDISKYTRAKIFSEVGKKTDMLIRFSTVAGEAGAADAERDVRGFAMKFYTEEGNWDLVGNNTPVFFVRDPLKFPDFIHTQKRHPKTNLRSTTAMWDFWSLSPRKPAPGHHPDVRPRPPAQPPLHERLRQPHLQLLERERRTFLGKVPLQNPARPPLLNQRRSLRRRRPNPRKLSGGSLRLHRSRRLPPLDHASPNHARSRRRKNSLQSLRPNQSLAPRRLPVDRSRHRGTQPQPRKLFRADRASRLQPLE